MCLSRVDTPEEMKKYLSRRPDEFTAYKVVRVRFNKLWPSIFQDIPFKRGNNLSRRKKAIRADRRGTYVPCFHCFAKKKDAIAWSSYETIIPIKIKKKNVTTVGFQGCFNTWQVFITKRFYIDPKVYNKAVGKK